MKRRILAVVAAVLLAAVGAVGLYAYVHTADQRAMAGQETAEVLVVTKAIPTGTPSAELTKSVATKLLPATAIAPGAIANLDQVAGLIATVDLQPGEQVLSTRFVDPATLTDAQSTPVPKGLQEVSLQLNQAQALGGNIVPGDTVGMFFTVESKQGAEPEKQTHLTFHKVLVSKVQGGLAPLPDDSKNADEAAPMPDGRSLMVTLAVTAPQAEKIVFTAENGSIWLSHESADANQDGTQIVTEGKLFQ